MNTAIQKGLTAHKQPLSGMLADYPGDAVIEDYLIECKVRAASLAGGRTGVRVEYGWLFKVLKEAQTAGYRTGIVVVRPKGSQRKFILMDFDDALELIAKSIRTPEAQ